MVRHYFLKRSSNLRLYRTNTSIYDSSFQPFHAGKNKVLSDVQALSFRENTYNRTRKGNTTKKLRFYKPENHQISNEKAGVNKSSTRKVPYKNVFAINDNCCT